MKKTAFVSWSGGKDCSLALYSFLKNSKKEVSHLVHITDSSLQRNAHYIGADLLACQSKALNIPLIVEEYAVNQTYEYQLKSIISDLKKQGVDTGVFGDIHLKEHREWIERVCQEIGITPIFPLWNCNTLSILEELVYNGFRTIVTAVKNKQELSTLIGRELNNDLISELKQIQGIDLCGEHGEYHTFVFDSPLYNKPLSIVHGEKLIEDDCIFLSLSINK